MRTYLILKAAAKRWNADKEIQSLLQENLAAGKGAPSVSKYSKASVKALMGASLDREVIAERGLAYEKLDQLTTEVLLGVR
jgi:xylose isomerase